MEKKLQYISIFLFPIWPFGAFLYSLLFFKSKTTNVVFISFFMLLGYSFTFKNYDVDSYRYALAFIEFNHTRIDFWRQYLNGELTDLYTFIISFCVNEFSYSPKTLFAFYGLIFGLFYYLSLRLFVKERIGKNNIYFFILLFLVSFINPYSNLNGVRFWTTIFVFFYSLTQIIVFKKKSWFCGIVISFFIHYSFLFPIIVFIFYLLVGNKQKIYWNIFLISIIVFLFFDIISINSFDFLGSEFNSKINYYLNKEYINELSNIRKTASIKYQVLTILPKYFSFVLLFYVKNNISKIKKDITIDHLFSITLLFFSFSNVLNSVPSMGRFYTLSTMLLFYLLFKIYNLNRTKLWNIFIIMLLPIFSVNIYFAIDLGNSLLSPTLYTGNLFSILSESFN